ncbi:unnamed protein product [Pedinophyceae sp. YPF-701]|nr:unnamed protein product [Pedinophyceae sp. YPF-701]
MSTPGTPRGSPTKQGLHGGSNADKIALQDCTILCKHASGGQTTHAPVELKAGVRSVKDEWLLFEDPGSKSVVLGLFVGFGPHAKEAVTRVTDRLPALLLRSLRLGTLASLEIGCVNVMQKLQSEFKEAAEDEESGATVLLVIFRGGQDAVAMQLGDSTAVYAGIDGKGAASNVIDLIPTRHTPADPQEAMAAKLAGARLCDATPERDVVVQQRATGFISPVTACVGALALTSITAVHHTPAVLWNDIQRSGYVVLASPAVVESMGGAEALVSAVHHRSHHFGTPVHTVACWLVKEAYEKSKTLNDGYGPAAHGQLTAVVAYVGPAGGRDVFTERRVLHKLDARAAAEAEYRAMLGSGKLQARRAILQMTREADLSREEGGPESPQASRDERPLRPGPFAEPPRTLRPSDMGSPSIEAARARRRSTGGWHTERARDSSGNELPVSRLLKQVLTAETSEAGHVLRTFETSGSGVEVPGAPPLAGRRRRASASGVPLAPPRVRPALPRQIHPLLDAERADDGPELPAPELSPARKEVSYRRGLGQTFVPPRRAPAGDPQLAAMEAAVAARRAARTDTAGGGSEGAQSVASGDEAGARQFSTAKSVGRTAKGEPDLAKEVRPELQHRIEQLVQKKNKRMSVDGVARP